MPYHKKQTASRKHKKTTMSSYVSNTYIMSKLLKMNTANLYYGVREVNELENQQGALTLSDNQLGNTAPLHMISLHGIINNSSTGGGLWTLQNNGFDFTKLKDIEFMGATGNITQSPSTQQVSSLLQRYVDARLLLWSSSARKTYFKVSLVKLFDKDLDPESLTTTTDVNIQKKRALFYYYKNVRSQISNPIISNEVYGNQLKGKYKVLWSKEYGIDELLNDRDEHHYKEVRIFKKLDEIKHFRENPLINNSANNDDPDVIKYEEFSSQVNPIPLQSQRLYLMITANTTLSQAEDSVNFHTATYDLNVKCKYTTTERL